MILSRLAIGPRFNEKLFKKNSLCFSIFEFRDWVYINISGPNYWILFGGTGDNSITTSSSSSFSAKSVAQVEKISEEKINVSAPLRELPPAR